MGLYVAKGRAGKHFDDIRHLHRRGNVGQRDRRWQHSEFGKGTRPGDAVGHQTFALLKCFYGSLGPGAELAVGCPWVEIRFLELFLKLLDLSATVSKLE